MSNQRKRKNLPILMRSNKSHLLALGRVMYHAVNSVQSNGIEAAMTDVVDSLEKSLTDYLRGNTDVGEGPVVRVEYGDESRSTTSIRVRYEEFSVVIDTRHVSIDGDEPDDASLVGVYWNDDMDNFTHCLEISRGQLRDIISRAAHVFKDKSKYIVRKIPSGEDYVGHLGDVVGMFAQTVFDVLAEVGGLHVDGMPRGHNSVLHEAVMFAFCENVAKGDTRYDNDDEIEGPIS